MTRSIATLSLAVAALFLTASTFAFVTPASAQHDHGAQAHDHGAQAHDHGAQAHDHGDAHSHGDAAHGEAAHGEAHGFDTFEFVGSLVNFVIWIGILVMLLRKPLTTFLESRRADVEDGLKEAALLKEEAEAKFNEYSGRLEKLDEELEKLRKEMIHAGETERDRIIEDAEARAARMRRDANFLIQQQMKVMRQELTEEAIEAAIGAAETLLTEQSGLPDQQRLATDYLGELGPAMKQEVRA